MKLFSLLCAAFVTVATLTPTTARAGHDSGERTRVTYDNCGRPIYWIYTCVGEDSCGRTIYRWVQASRGGYSGRGSYSGYEGGYGRGSYSGGRDRCDYDRGYGYSRGRSGISFHFSR